MVLKSIYQIELRNILSAIFSAIKEVEGRLLRLEIRQPLMIIKKKRLKVVRKDRILISFSVFQCFLTIIDDHEIVAKRKFMAKVKMAEFIDRGHLLT